MSESTDLEEAILRAVDAARALGKTACPTQVAREALGGAEAEQVATVRAAAAGLVAEGRIVFWWRGRAVDPATFTKPVRLARPDQVRDDG